MGTELLKEQYNNLLNDQKSKLQKLREKKLANKQLNDKDELKMNNFDDDNNELDLDNDVFSKFNKLEDIDSDSDNNDGKPKNNYNKKSTFNKSISNDNKNLQIKKNPSKNKFGNSYPKNNDLFGDSESINDKLRELKDENGRFRKLLLEKEYEINFLKKKMENEKVVEGLGPISGDAAATKIVDLAKKVRELTANLESEKTKNKQIAKSFKDLENQFIKSKEKKREYFENDEDNDFSDDEQIREKINLSKENKELKEKLNQTSHKMMEFKSQSECLKVDVKKYQKALEKELGDNVDIKGILSGNSNWKGRNTQIRMLQNKIKDLKDQVGGFMGDSRASQILDDEDLLNETNDFMKGPPRSAQFSNYTFNSMSTTRTNGDSRQKMELKKIEKERREQIEQLKKDSELMEIEINTQKKNLEASKSRNAVVSNENKTLREQTKTLMEKGKHDNELIDALMKKQSQLKGQYDSLINEKDKVSKESENNSTESQVKRMQEKNTIDQLKSILADREKRVKSLENELEHSRLNSGMQVQTGSEFFINSTKNDDSRENSFNRPVSVNKNSSNFIERENSSRVSMRSSMNNQRPQSSQNGLNAKLIDQKKELTKDYKLEISELTTLHKTSEIERVRLLELVKTLQKRIEELNDKSMDNENKLNEQRRRSVNSEKQLEKLKLQENKSAAGKQKTQMTQPSNSSISLDHYKFEELETSLLIQKDENDALKAALKSTLEAKEEDLRLYVEMLESTKRVFLDGLKQYKQTATD